MLQYTYQTNEALTRITPDLIYSQTLNDPIFDSVFPIRNRNASRLRWLQKDNYRGIMNARGLGGEPTRVNPVGENIYETQPCVFGEFMTLDEVAMTEFAQGIPADVMVPINISDRVAQMQEQLVIREVARMRQLAWGLAVNGTLGVTLPTGGIAWKESYPVQTITVSPLWSDIMNSTPAHDMRIVHQSFGIGTSNSFRSDATAYMNTLTYNFLISNGNAADLGRVRSMYGETINGEAGITNYFAINNIPAIVIFDQGYLDENGVFQLYIPTGKIMIVGKRPTGETPGEFQITRNANNPNQEPKPYSFIKDYTTGVLQSVPPKIEVHMGFNGGPVVERASQIVIMNVA